MRADYTSIGVPPPLADWYTSPRQRLPRDPERLPAYEVLAPSPHLNASALVGPSYSVTPQSIASVYAHRLLRITPVTPVTKWQSATGYSTIRSRQVEALAGPFYNYAGYDTEQLLDDYYEA